MASSQVDHNDNDRINPKKRRKQRLSCKGSFKGTSSKFTKEGGQPMPGILDFPASVSLSKGSLMHGCLVEGETLVRVLRSAGKLVAHMGFVKPSSKGAQFLHPEEAVFLIETGRLVVNLNKSDENIDESKITTQMCIRSVQEAYCRLLTPSITLTNYIVYAHLSRAGYKVLISESPSRKVRMYDAHAPVGDFAKTRPPPPKFRVVSIFRWDEQFPSIPELLDLGEECSKGLTNDVENQPQNSVALKIAIVAPDGDVSFYSINCPTSC